MILDENFLLQSPAGAAEGPLRKSQAHNRSLAGVVRRREAREPRDLEVRQDEPALQRLKETLNSTDIDAIKRAHEELGRVMQARAAGLLKSPLGRSCSLAPSAGPTLPRSWRTRNTSTRKPALESGFRQRFARSNS